MDKVIMALARGALSRDTCTHSVHATWQEASLQPADTLEVRYCGGEAPGPGLTAAGCRATILSAPQDSWGLHAPGMWQPEEAILRQMALSVTAGLPSALHLVCAARTGNHGKEQGCLQAGVTQNSLGILLCFPLLSFIERTGKWHSCGLVRWSVPWDSLE